MLLDNKKDVEFEVLIATMFRTSLSFLDKMFVNNSISNYNILVINQTKQGQELESNLSNIRVINSFERGLSNSRNLAVKYAKGNVILFADDDVVYEKNLKAIILKAHSKFTDAAIVTFQLVDFNGRFFRNYVSIEAHTKHTVGTVNSVVISAKLKLIKQLNFNPFFGLGAAFETGEENLYLLKALKKGLKLYYQPEIILKHPVFSSGKDDANNKLIYARGAYYYEKYGLIGYLKLAHYLYLVFKKGLISLADIIPKLKHGLKGIKACKNVKYSD